MLAGQHRALSSLGPELLLGEQSLLVVDYFISKCFKSGQTIVFSQDKYVFKEGISLMVSLDLNDLSSIYTSLKLLIHFSNSICD